MGVQQIGFEQLIFSMASNANLNGDISQGPVSPLVNIPQWSQFLQDAVLWAWWPSKERPEVPWPYSLAAGSLTVTNGVITYAQVGEADFWRLWSADPRIWQNRPANNGSAYPIADSYDTFGIYPSSSLTTVFGFWRPMRPLFALAGQYLPVSTQAYPLNFLLYDASTYLIGTTQTSTTILMASTTGLYVGQAVFGPGIPPNTQIQTITLNTSIVITNAATSSISNADLIFGTGNVFKAIVANAIGANILDGITWLMQTVPDPLVRPILAHAEGLRIKSRGNDPAKLLAEAETLLDQEEARALPETGPPSPWFFDFAG